MSTPVKVAVDPILKKMVIDEVIDGKMTIPKAAQELDVAKATISYYLGKRGYIPDGAGRARRMTPGENAAFREKDAHTPHTFRGADRPGPISPRASEVLDKAVQATQMTVLQERQPSMLAMVVDDENVAAVLDRVRQELEDDRKMLEQAMELITQRNAEIESLRASNIKYGALAGRVTELEELVDRQLLRIKDLEIDLQHEQADAEFGRNERKRQGLQHVQAASEMTAKTREALREELGRQLAHGTPPEGYGEHR